MDRLPGEDKGKESPVVIRNREELIFMLSEAATLEHMIMCLYLFVSFAFKQDVAEGITADQLDAIRRWDRTIVKVAEQEMLHLSLANNLLNSIGAAPYFDRPNFPYQSRFFPSHVKLVLMPLDEISLRFFLYLERPETIAVEDVPGFEARDLTVDPEGIVPEGQEFATVGQLYRGIERGLEYLVKNNGETEVFVGSPAAQATEEYFGWPELIAVKDMASARKAIETIVTEGEGARGHWKNSHFGRFLGILTEYQELKKSDPSFSPSRPALSAFARPPGDADEVELIDDEFTSGVSDLFNASYGLLLQTLSRFFLQVETTPEELQTLSDTSVRLMLNIIKPIGTLLTTLPVGPHRPGLTAGPTFEMYPMSYLLPRSRAAWTILHERLLELRGRCSQLAGRSSAQNVLLAVGDELDGLAKEFERPASP